MRELTKAAVEALYEDDLKHQLEAAFQTLMAEIKELPEAVYGQYAINALKNLVQLSARGVTDLNIYITEYLNDPDTLYANYEGAFEEIKALDELVLSKKYQQDRHYEDYLRKKQNYELMQKEYDQEKGARTVTRAKASSLVVEDGVAAKRRVQDHE